MKIHVACTSLSGLTGSEVYNYELIRGLMLAGHEVTFNSISNKGFISGYFKSGIEDSICEEIDVYSWKPDYNFHYGFDIYCKKGKYDSHTIPDSDFIICSQSATVDVYAQWFPKEKIVQICHHEFYPEEVPNPKAGFHVSCRPMYDCHVIGNPVDFSRFNYENKNRNTSDSYAILPGSIDVFRYPILKELSKFWKGQLLAIGRNDFPEIEGVTYLDPNFNAMPFLLKNAQVCYGVFYGRTRIESLACGTPYVNVNTETGQLSNAEMPEWNPEFGTWDLHSQESFTKFTEEHSTEAVVNRLIKYITNER